MTKFACTPRCMMDNLQLIIFTFKIIHKIALNEFVLFFSVFSVFAWSCVIDLIIALELDGVIDNFISFYFKEVS